MPHAPLTKRGEKEYHSAGSGFKIFRSGNPGRRSCPMRLLLSARGEMVSWTRTAVASGVTADAMGPVPNGYIAYHADGRLALVVGREKRKSRSPPTTVEEKAALFDTMLAYAAS